MQKLLRVIGWAIAGLLCTYAMLAILFIAVGTFFAVTNNNKTVSLLCDHPDRSQDSYEGDLRWSAIPPGWHCQWDDRGEDLRTFTNASSVLGAAIAGGALAYYLNKTKEKGTK